MELRLNGAFVQSPAPTAVRASRAGNADAGASTGVVTVGIGLGRTAALYYRSSTSYQIRL